MDKDKVLQLLQDAKYKVFEAFELSKEPSLEKDADAIWAKIARLQKKIIHGC